MPASIFCCRSRAGKPTASHGDYQEATFETLTWATGLLAATKRITVFGTVHAPLFHPIMAAKQMVTADHVGDGRFGLNVVVGWNEGEFDMFGVDQREHEAALCVRAGMARHRQGSVVAARGFRFQWQIFRTERHQRQAEAGRRRAARDHECRRVADRPRLRDPQLRCVLHQRHGPVGRRSRAKSCRRRRTTRARSAANSMSIPSASSPAGRRNARPTTTITTRSSRMPTGPRSTTFWRPRISRPDQMSAPEFHEKRQQSGQRHGRLAAGRHARPGRRATGKSRERGPARHRRVVRQLRRRTAVSSAPKCCRGCNGWELRRAKT